MDIAFAAFFITFNISVTSKFGVVHKIINSMKQAHFHVISTFGSRLWIRGVYIPIKTINQWSLYFDEFYKSVIHIKAEKNYYQQTHFG